MNCHICGSWKPEHGCRHYLPDAKTVLEANGWTVVEKNGYVYLRKPGVRQHRFNSIDKAAKQLVHDKKPINLKQ